MCRDGKKKRKKTLLFLFFRPGTPSAFLYGSISRSAVRQRGVFVLCKMGCGFFVQAPTALGVARPLGFVHQQKCGDEMSKMLASMSRGISFCNPYFGQLLGVGLPSRNDIPFLAEPLGTCAQKTMATTSVSNKLPLDKTGSRIYLSLGGGGRYEQGSLISETCDLLTSGF